MKKNEIKVSVIIENGMVKKETVEIFYSEDYNLLQNFNGNRLGSDEAKESGNYVVIKKEECLHAIVNFYCQNSKLNRTIAVKYVAEYYQKSDMKIFTANTTLFEKFLNRCALNHDEKI